MEKLFNGFPAGFPAGRSRLAELGSLELTLQMAEGRKELSASSIVYLMVPVLSFVSVFFLCSKVVLQWQYLL